MNKLIIPGRILIVDDDEEDHYIIRHVGQGLGIASSMNFFLNGHELLLYLKATPENPFIILCDINMPEINGLDLREVIWKDASLRRRSIPFIFFSTNATQGQVEKAYDLTVQGFFLKGNSLAEAERKLRLIVEYWMESRQPNNFL